MNTVKQTTFADRLRNAIRSFKGQPIGSLTLGVDVKKCNECEYKNHPCRELHEFSMPLPLPNVHT